METKEKNYMIELNYPSTKMFGVDLYRIVATKDFDYIKKGDLGGYICKETQLNNNSWIDKSSICVKATLNNSFISYNSKIYNSEINSSNFLNSEGYNSKINKTNSVIKSIIYNSYMKCFSICESYCFDSTILSSYIDINKSLIIDKITITHD